MYYLLQKVYCSLCLPNHINCFLTQCVLGSFRSLIISVSTMRVGWLINKLVLKFIAYLTFKYILSPFLFKISPIYRGLNVRGRWYLKTIKWKMIGFIWCKDCIFLAGVWERGAVHFGWNEVMARKGRWEAGKCFLDVISSRPGRKGRVSFVISYFVSSGLLHL